MTDPAGDIALRKKLLVARSSLHRLHVRHDVHALRETLSWPRVAKSAAASPAGRGALILLAAEVLGTERVAGWLSFARRALGIAKIALVGMALFRARRASGPDDPR